MDRILVEAVDGGLRFTEETESGQGGCFLAGITRSIAIRVGDPAALGAVELVSQP